MNKPEELHQKYTKLKNLIQNRQAFEAKNNFPPFSTFKTTLDFKDVHGKTLLSYAIALGNQEHVMTLVEQGAQYQTSLSDALKQGQLSIAQWLYTKKAPASCIALHDVTDPDCQAWFTNIIKVDIRSEITCVQNRASLDTRTNPQTFKIYKSWDEADVADLYQRIAEIGDINLLQEYTKTGGNNLNNNVYSSMMVSAASNNCVAMMNYLSALGGKINPEKLFEKSPLIQAIARDNHDAINYLLNNGADINYQGEDKLTPLAWAVVKGNETLVTRLLKSGADVTLKDTNGRSVFHYAARDGKLIILKSLLEDPRAQQIRTEQDIFGLIPKDYVSQINKVETLKILGYDGNDPDTKLKSKIIANQSRVIATMSYYLRSLYRDPKYFSSDGNCNGFNFLEEMYEDDGRIDYYDDTLQLMAEWDGEHESLLRYFPDSFPQKQWYQNLSELFEQWLNDVIWFQHSNLEDLYHGGALRPDQGNRSFQYQVAGGKRQPIIISYTGSNDIDLRGLTELLELFSQRMVTGTRLELVGSEHATASAIDGERKFSYSDPNFTRKTRKFNNQSELSQVVIDTKIIALKKLCHGFNFECRARFFYFERPTITQRLEEHKSFLDHEVPRSLQEAEDYQARSPNGYSHLQVAILTGSVLSIKQIIALGYYDLTATNKNGQTALTMALNTYNVEIVDLILALYNSTSPAPYSAFHDFFASGEQFKARMAYRHFDKIDNLVPIINSRLRLRDDLSHSFLKLNSININSFFQGESPLSVAFKSQDLAMIKLVLKHGASLFYTDPNDWSDFNTPLNHLVTSNVNIVEALLDSQFPDINQADDKGNSLIHYLPRANASTACYLLSEVINRKGDFKKMSATGKTLFDILKDSLNDEVKEQLYSQLIPLLDYKNEIDATILRDLYGDAVEKEKSQRAALIMKNFPEISSIVNRQNYNTILKN